MRQSTGWAKHRLSPALQERRDNGGRRAAQRDCRDCGRDQHAVRSTEHRERRAATRRVVH